MTKKKDEPHEPARDEKQAAAKEHAAAKEQEHQQAEAFKDEARREAELPGEYVSAPGRHEATGPRPHAHLHDEMRPEPLPDSPPRATARDKARGKGEGGEEDRPPPFGTQVPLDAHGPVPRVVEPNGRVPRDLLGRLFRYKVRCANYGDNAALYVLAADEDSARACYMGHQHIDAELDRARRNRSAVAGSPPPEPPEIFVKRLAD